jgi:hypothetical protein
MAHQRSSSFTRKQWPNFPLKKGYLESEAGRATWDDVLVSDGPTFEAPPMEESKFEETTSNAPPAEDPAPEEPAHDAPPVEVDPPMEEAPVDSWGTWGVPTKKVKNARAQSRRQQAAGLKPKLADLADFHSLSFPLLAPRNNHKVVCKPTEYFDRCHSYSGVFLCHASLWAVADYRLINPLKALALSKLHKTLCVFKLDDKNADDVIDLARFAYSEDGGGGAKWGLLDGGAMTLRGLVCHYMAENAVVLSVHDGFMELVREGGDFVKDFFSLVVRRIN